MPSGPSRHCQKCCKWHELSAFSGSNRTCSRRLAEQTARRRRDGGGGGGSTARGSSSATDASSADEEALRFSFVEAFMGGAGLPAAVAPAEALAVVPEAWMSSAAALPLVREASLKLGGATPGQLPSTLAPILRMVWCNDVAFSLEATPQPGCTLLHLDALLPADAPPAPDAATLARALRASSLRSWLAGRSMRVQCGDIAEPAASSQPPTRLPRLRPAALLCNAPGELRAPRPARPLPHEAVLCGRLHGQKIAQLRFTASPDGSLRFTLPATGAEGAARFWLATEGGNGSASRAVLLTTDAAIAAEVSVALDAENDANAEEHERLICALGAALRPGCPARVVAAAAHATLRRGWSATSARLLPALLTALVGTDVDGVAAARTLLHAAALSGDVQLVRLTLLHGGSDHAFGAPETADEHGITPMHLAAAAGYESVIKELALATPNALLAFFYVRSLEGKVTPADVARATGGAAAETSAVPRRRLEAARDLAAVLVGGADGKGSDPQLVELARFLLDKYAPVDGAMSAPERALFYEHRMASLRYLALITPPFVIVINLRALSLPPLDLAVLAAVALPAQPRFWQLLDVYKQVQQPFVPLTVLVNLLLLALAGLPMLRAVYRRHGRAVLRAYAVFQFIARRTLAELHQWRVLHGNSVVWPSPAGAAVMAVSTVHMAAMPLPAPDIAALLTLQWIFATIAHSTGLPMWPNTAAPLRDALLRTALHAMLMAAVRATETRALASWRTSRRFRLTARAKQA